MARNYQIKSNKSLDSMVDYICSIAGHDKYNEGIKDAIRRYAYKLGYIEKTVEVNIQAYQSPTIVSPSESVNNFGGTSSFVIPPNVGLKATLKPVDPKDYPIIGESVESYVARTGGGEVVRKNDKWYRRTMDGALEKDTMLPDRFQ